MSVKKCADIKEKKKTIIMKNNKEKGMLYVKHTLFYVKINYKT